MIPFVIILALYLEPVGSIIEEPYDFVEQIQFIDVQPIEELERKLRLQDLRIMEMQPQDWTQ